MLNPKPFINKKRSRVWAPNYGDTGRYFYVLCNAVTPNVIVIIDKTLLTAANYAGAGVWTVSPIIATVSTADAVAYKALVYVSATQEVLMIAGTGAAIRALDVNPLSPTYHTISRNLSATGMMTQNGGSAGYDYTRNIVLLGGGNNAMLLDPVTGETAVYGFTPDAQIYRCRGTKYDANLDAYFFYDETIGCVFFDPDSMWADKWPIAVKLFLISHAWSSDRYLYDLHVNNIYIRDPNFETQASLGSVNSRICRAGFSEKNRRLVAGSFFTNSFSFVEEITRTLGANLAKGYTDVNETGTREITVSDDVAIAVPSTTITTPTFNFVHVLDVLNRSYIGYLPLGHSIGSFQDANGYNGGLTCKNRVEI